MSKLESAKIIQIPPPHRGNKSHFCSQLVGVSQINQYNSLLDISDHLKMYKYPLPSFVF